jgi:hypothetical protein
VWEWFFELSAQRKSGPEHLGFAEIGEWQRLLGRYIRPEEIKMILAMDTAYVSALKKEQQLLRERTTPPASTPAPPKKTPRK